MDSGQEQNYWPGFVDALSNVVLTLVFVLVVFVFALSMSATQVTQKMEEIVRVEKAQKAAQAAQAAQAAPQVNTASGKSDSTALSAQQNGIEIVSETKQEAKKSDRGAVNVAAKANEIMLSYPLAVLDLDDKSSTSLTKTLSETKDKVGTNYTVLLQSIPGEEPYSVAQRLAYYRAIKIRNYLIEKGIATSTTIRSKIVQPTEPGLGHVQIIFQRQ